MSRDIKGANLLCTTKGRIKVADFGCSTWFEGGRSVKALTNSGSRSNGDALLGSIPWMAPEALRQERSGRKSDVWSLGCVVVEMATGHRPWAHVSHPLTLLYHVATTSSHPEFPASLSPLARCGVAVVRWWGVGSVASHRIVIVTVAVCRAGTSCASALQPRRRSGGAQRSC